MGMFLTVFMCLLGFVMNLGVRTNTPRIVCEHGSIQSLSDEVRVIYLYI